MAAGTACGRSGITNWSRFVPVAEALSRLVPNSDSRLILLIRHAQERRKVRAVQLILFDPRFTHLRRPLDKLLAPVEKARPGECCPCAIGSR
jgi:hypothetical protein